MKQKKQIVLIHGGMTFKNNKDYLNYLKTRTISLEKRKEKWSDDYLAENLGKSFEIIRPNMPLPDNAKYEDWKIHFERYFEFLRGEVILIGKSLGGIFLAKYLSENKFKGKLKAVYLIAPPFDNTLEGEDLAGGFKLKNDLSLLEKNCPNTTLFFSMNDDVVPAEHAKKYAVKLKQAQIFIFKNKNGHFQVPKFPEIVKMIKAL